MHRQFGSVDPSVSPDGWIRSAVRPCLDGHGGRLDDRQGTAFDEPPRCRSRCIDGISALRRKSRSALVATGPGRLTPATPRSGGCTVLASPPVHATGGLRALAPAASEVDRRAI